MKHYFLSTIGCLLLHWTPLASCVFGASLHQTVKLSLGHFLHTLTRVTTLPISERCTHAYCWDTAVKCPCLVLASCDTSAVPTLQSLWTFFSNILHSNKCLELYQFMFLIDVITAGQISVSGCWKKKFLFKVTIG
jgi:hypothetical protein